MLVLDLRMAGCLSPDRTGCSAAGAAVSLVEGMKRLLDMLGFGSFDTEGILDSLGNVVADSLGIAVADLVCPGAAGFGAGKLLPRAPPAFTGCVGFCAAASKRLAAPDDLAGDISRSGAGGDDLSLVDDCDVVEWGDAG